ncbi:11168_t:CDS:2, partial [Funneliformis caledonium]
KDVQKSFDETCNRDSPVKIRDQDSSVKIRDQDSLKTSNVNRIQYIQNDISAITTYQTINQRILLTANANQVTNITQKNTQDSLSFPVTTYSRNRSVDKSSFKYHDKRSHIDDLDSSNSVKQKFILCYKPSEQKELLSEIQPDLNKQIIQKDNSINCTTLDMLAILINEAKILFLRSRDSSTVAYDTLLKSIAPGFSENNKTMSFLKMKLGSYFADH